MRIILILFFVFQIIYADDFNALIEEYPSSNDKSKINIVIKDNIDIEDLIFSLKCQVCLT